MKKLLTNFSVPPLLRILLLLLLFALPSVKAFAQDDEDESRLPDDSILIAEQVIDSIPTKYNQEKIEKVLSAFLDDYKLRYDFYADGDANVYFTFAKDISREQKYYDRKLKIVFVFFVDNSSQLRVRLYATQKISSAGRSWEILDKKTMGRMEAYETSFCKQLKKRFRGKVSSGVSAKL